jgi:hypothetical protein
MQEKATLFGLKAMFLLQKRALLLSSCLSWQLSYLVRPQFDFQDSGNLWQI